MPAKGPKLNYRNLEDRLKTFKLPPQWGGPVDYQSMAEAGFVYTGQEDLVCCFSCNVKLDRWSKDMEPLLRHKEENPTCSFMREKLQIVKGPRSVSYSKCLESSGLIFTKDKSLDLQHPDYSEEAVRLQSFKHWGGVLPARELAEGGFYMIARRDVVRCFSCNVVVQDWERSDNVINEHHRHSPNCPFLVQLLNNPMKSASLSGDGQPSVGNPTIVYNTYSYQYVKLRTFDEPYGDADLQPPPNMESGSSSTPSVEENIRGPHKNCNVTEQSSYKSHSSSNPVFNSPVQSHNRSPASTKSQEPFHDPMACSEILPQDTRQPSDPVDDTALSIQDPPSTPSQAASIDHLLNCFQEGELTSGYNPTRTQSRSSSADVCVVHHPSILWPIELPPSIKSRSSSNSLDIDTQEEAIPGIRYPPIWGHQSMSPQVASRKISEDSSKSFHSAESHGPDYNILSSIDPPKTKIMVIPQSFIQHVQLLISETERCNFSNNFSTGLLNQVEAALLTIEEGIQLLLPLSVYSTDHSMLVRFRTSLARCLRLLQYGFNDCTVPPVSILSRSLECFGYVGRPRLSVNIDAVEFLRNCRYTWDQVSNTLQVSRTTLWRRLREAGIEIKKYTEISDDELDTMVSQLQRENPNCGQQMMCGYLRDRGINIQRYRLRSSIIRTDPVRRLARWNQVMATVYPNFIQPLFDTYILLPSGDLCTAIEQLAASLHFPLKKLFVVDGSKRSSHSNAYFYGFWKNKHIVLFDTLLDAKLRQEVEDSIAASKKEKKPEQQQQDGEQQDDKGEDENGVPCKEKPDKENEVPPSADDKNSEKTSSKDEKDDDKPKKQGCNQDEILAVLAHELGHWKLSHTLQHLVINQVNMFFMLYLFGYFMRQDLVYTSFGFHDGHLTMIGLFLVFQFIFSPYYQVLTFLIIQLTRWFEYQADRFAADLDKADTLQSALTKLNKDSLLPILSTPCSITHIPPSLSECVHWLPLRRGTSDLH